MTYSYRSIWLSLNLAMFDFTLFCDVLCGFRAVQPERSDTFMPSIGQSRSSLVELSAWTAVRPGMPFNDWLNRWIFSEQMQQFWGKPWKTLTCWWFIIWLWQKKCDLLVIPVSQYSSKTKCNWSINDKCYNVEVPAGLRLQTLEQLARLCCIYSWMDETKPRNIWEGTLHNPNRPNRKWDNKTEVGGRRGSSGSSKLTIGIPKFFTQT